MESAYPSPSDFVILAESITFSHSGCDASIFSSLSFSVAPKEILCVCGINGSGKSTLLQILASLFLPTKGSLWIHGMQAEKLQLAQNTKLRKKTALLLQDADLQILGETVEEDMLIGTDQSQTTKSAAKNLAEALGLASSYHKSPQQLSYGQKRKLCLATALLSSPDLLLLDEPLSGLDYPATLEMLARLRELQNKGVAMVISTHDLDMFAPLTKKLLFLSPALPPLYEKTKDLCLRAEEYGIRPPVRFTSSAQAQYT